MDTDGNVVRLTSFKIVPNNPFLSLTDDGFRDGKCEIDGFTGRFLYEFIIKPITTGGRNCTIQQYDRRGVYNLATGIYSGYLGAMQTGIKDGLIYLGSKPSTYVDGIKYTAPVQEVFLDIASAYNQTEEYQAIDIIDLYFKVGPKLHFISLFIGILFFFSWSAIQKLALISGEKFIKHERCKLLNGLWTLWRMVYNQASYINVPSRSLLIFITAMSAATFCAMNYLMDVVGTDLVVYKQPVLIRSYSDIVHRDDVNVTFISGVDDSIEFREARPDSVEGKLWKKRDLVYIGDFFRVSREVKFFNEFASQKKVLIMRDSFTEYFMFNVFHARKYRGTKKYLYGYLDRDETGKHFTEQILYSASAPKFWKDIVEKASHQMRESGIAEWTRKDGILFSQLVKYVPNGEYYGKHIHHGKVPDPLVALEHLDKLVNLCLTLFSISFLFLLHEIITHRNSLGIFTIPNRKLGRRRKRQTIKVVVIKRKI